ncbi:hypothetical protein [Pelomonas sp. Root1217]|uniref:hypothetical protein n=1 Tax=Pelomonas sp. Root1217 TaxID=1736430 RepID=UPI001F42F997|nr:hypothetical protein [Pelomonas sp. Root1217]
MTDFLYIDHVLASYFAASTGASDAEAVAQLRQHMLSSPSLARGLSEEVKRAFSEHTYSWRAVLAKCDVLCAEDEGEAKKYAQQLFAEIFAPA